MLLVLLLSLVVVVAIVHGDGISLGGIGVFCQQMLLLVVLSLVLLAL